MNVISKSIFAPAKKRTRANLLGSFECAILRTIEKLGTAAYGAEIGRYLTAQLNREITAPQVYMTLERLSRKGYVRSEKTVSVPEKGGRSRNRFILEADGVRALRETTAIMNAVPSTTMEQDAYGTKVDTGGELGSFTLFAAKPQSASTGFLLWASPSTKHPSGTN